MYIMQCDCCGKSSKPDNTTAYPDGWISIRLHVTGIPTHHYTGRNKLLCNECLPKYGILPKPDAEGRDSNLEKLWDIMLDLAEEARESI